MRLPQMFRSRTRLLARTSLLLALAALTTLIAVGDAPGRAVAEVSPCDVTPPPSPEAAVIDPAARLKPESEEAKLQFGRTRIPRVLELRANIIGTGPLAGTPIRFDVRRFKRSDDTEIPGQQIRVIGCVSNDRHQVRVNLYVDPERPSRVAPGTYTALLAVDDPAFDSANSTPFKLTVVLQEDRQHFPILILGFAALGAAMLQRGIRWWEDPASRSRDAGVSLLRRRGFRLGALEFLAGLVGGLVATIPVYLKHYDSDPAWTLDNAHGWGLLTTAFAAASAAYGISAGVIRRRDASRTATIAGPSSDASATPTSGGSASPTLDENAGPIIGAGGTGTSRIDGNSS